MKIETKANIGDSIHYLENGVVSTSEIVAIQIRIIKDDFDPKPRGNGGLQDPFKRSSCGVYYYTDHADGNSHRISERRVFMSLEELAASIADGTHNDIVNGIEHNDPQPGSVDTFKLWPVPEQQ